MPHPCLPVFTVALHAINHKNAGRATWQHDAQQLQIGSFGQDDASTLFLLESFKKITGRLPAPAFSVKRYLESLPKAALPPAGLQWKSIDAYLHFIQTGVWLGAIFMSSKPSTHESKLLQDHFDEDCYEESLDELGISLPAAISPLKHYLGAGCSLSLMPIRNFCEYSYLIRYPDVALAVSRGSFRNGFIHYLRNGLSEGRDGQRLQSKSYINIYYPGLLDSNPQQAAESLASFTNFHGGLPFTHQHPGKTSLLLCLHTIDSEVKFGGLSAFYRIVNKLLSDLRIDRIDILLTDQDSGIAGALYQVTKPDHPLNKFRQKIHIHCLSSSASSRSSYSCATSPAIGEGTLAVAYNAKAAYILNGYKNAIKNFEFKWIYLIQEDESTFHAGGSLSASIRYTYSFDCAVVFNSSILERYFKANYPNISSGHSCSFAHQYILPKRAIQINEKQDLIVCYLRPEKHADRNCHEIITLALMESLRSYPELASWDFVGVGALSDHKIQLSPSIEMNCLSKLDYNSYSSLLSRAKVGISLMDAPHPSVVPFEMAGHGIVTITNTHNSRSAVDVLELSELSNIETCDLNHVSLSSAIIKAVKKWHSEEPFKIGHIEPPSASLEARWNDELGNVVNMIKDFYGLP